MAANVLRWLEGAALVQRNGEPSVALEEGECVTGGGAPGEEEPAGLAAAGGPGDSGEEEGQEPPAKRRRKSPGAGDKAATAAALSHLARATLEDVRYVAAGQAASGWLSTSLEPRSQHRIFGIDCEMVMCQGNGSALARVSLVEWIWSDGTTKTVLDEYVRPESEVIDYKTAVSGVEEHHLAAATLDRAGACEKICEVVARSDFLVGHNIAADLGSLRLTHDSVIDTAALFGVQGMRKWSLALRDVVSAYMKETDPEGVAKFQVDGESHDSVDDAKWALRVAMTEVQRLANGLGRSPPLAQTPLRFRMQLHIRSLPPESDEESVRKLFADGGAPLSSEANIREIKRNASNVIASTVVSFPDDRQASDVFTLLCANSACWIDEEGMYCVNLPDDSLTLVRTYERCPMEASARGIINPSVLGKVIGKGGMRLRAIRKQSGAWVRVLQPDRGGGRGGGGGGGGGSGGGGSGGRGGGGGGGGAR
mmetsp:Transcript_2295/g.8379  ORF Transcript_2295/g.8379 Transcript_2295/m.8379 type:complete len:480 (-) Transcript_2295:604-2043(-)